MSFPEVALGTVLRRTGRFEARDALKEYTFAGTYSFGRGIFVGERRLGEGFRLPKIQRLLTDDFVYCKIMAWEGAFGVVPPEANGCVVSGAFVVYELDRTRVDPRYLSYYFQVKETWSRIGRQSTGTNVRRRSLHPDTFESQTIRLPSLAEQRRIIQRIEELTAPIEEARRARNDALEALQALIPACALQLLHVCNAGACHYPLLDVCDFEGGNQPPKSLFRYEPTPGFVRFLQIRDFSSDDYLTFIPESRRNALAKRDDVLVGRYGASLGKILRGKEGAYNVAMCKAVPKRADVDLDFLAVSLAYGTFQRRLSEISRSAQAGFNKKDLRGVEIVLPPLQDQRRIVARLDDLQTKVKVLKTLQEKTAAELDAVLPSILDKAFRGEL